MVSTETEDRDNFGELSNTRKTVLTGQHDVLQGDGFGACQASTPASDPQNEVGDVEAENQTTETPDDDNDDALGDFGSSPTSIMTNQGAINRTISGAANKKADWAPPTPKADANPESSSDGDEHETVAEEEIHRGSAENPVPFQAPPHSSPTEEFPAETDADEFGDFGSATNKMEGNVTEDLFGDFNEPPPKEIKPTKDPCVVFNGPACGTQDTSPCAQVETAPERPPADEEVGGFDGTTTSVKEYSAMHCANEAVGKTEDDITCGFEEFESASATETDDVPVPTPTPATTEKNQPKAGDFGGFDNGPVARRGDFSPPTTENSNDIDFGDFEGCDRALVPGADDDVAALMPAAAEKLGDDSFGDFGGFDCASATVIDDGAPIRTPPTATAENLKGDDFQGFGSAPGTGINDTLVTAPAIATTDRPDDENFGDFGGFNSAPATEIDNRPARAVATSEIPHDDDFGNFGDFDSAPADDKAPTQQKQTTNSQIQPGRSGPGTSCSVQIEQESSTAALDPVLHKAKIVFSKVFERFKLKHSSYGSCGSGETIEVAGFHLTASMGIQRNGSSGGKLMNGFHTILEEFQKEDCLPVFIVTEGQVHSPDAHFSLPVNGEAFGPSVETQRLNAGMSQHQQVSTQSTPPSQPTQPTAATMVQLPHQTSTATKNVIGGAPEKAQRLLRQIPDLSSMLQFKLRLPSNMK